MTIRIPIATRLLLAFATVIVIYGGAVALSIVRLGDFKATVHSITAGDLPKQKTANEWITAYQQYADSRGP